MVGKCETNYEKQWIIASIQDEVSLYGKEIIQKLKDRIEKYPLELSKRMIEENLLLSNCWNNREVLLKRKDWLILYDVIGEVEKNIFASYLALTKCMCIILHLNGPF